jgi:hypothetical protein
LIYSKQWLKKHNPGCGLSILANFVALKKKQGESEEKVIKKIKRQIPFNYIQRYHLSIGLEYETLPA